MKRLQLALLGMLSLAPILAGCGTFRDYQSLQGIAEKSVIRATFIGPDGKEAPLVLLAGVHRIAILSGGDAYNAGESRLGEELAKKFDVMTPYQVESMLRSITLSNASDRATVLTTICGTLYKPDIVLTIQAQGSRVTHDAGSAESTGLVFLADVLVYGCAKKDELERTSFVLVVEGKPTIEEMINVAVGAWVDRITHEVEAGEKASGTS